MLKEFLMSFSKKRNDKVSIKNYSEIVYSYVTRYTVLTTKKIAKELNINPKGPEWESLKFCLTIYFLVVASDEVCYPFIRSEKQIRMKAMQGAIDLFFKELDQQRENNKGYFNAEDFVKIKDEYSFCCSILSERSGLIVEKLGLHDLYSLACVLFNKRFLEYEDLLHKDRRPLDHKELPLLNFRVYLHWTGESKITPDSITFMLITTQYMVRFFTELGDRLFKIKQII